MRILAIGNSFSQDATHYLHQLDQHQELDYYNLMIGGCTLERHWENIRNNAVEYYWEHNGVQQEGFVSLAATLVNKQWDCITLQQASHESYRPESYQPYLHNLNGFIHALAPKARIVLHQTWAYQEGCEALLGRGFSARSEMFAGLQQAYGQAAKELGTTVIPCGLAMEKALAVGLGPLQRDWGHASFGAGRYLLAAVWYAFFTGRRAKAIETEEPMEEKTASIMQDIALEVVKTDKSAPV